MNHELAEICIARKKRIDELEKENAELRAIVENQQSNNMSRYFENKKLKEGLAVGSTLNKGLISMNKAIEFGYNKAFVEADKNLKAVVTDFNKAKEEAKTIIQDLLSNSDEYARQRAMDFLKEVEKKWD